MKIKKIKVEGLYGLHNYEITFEQQEKIKIIHAPNGYGKTTILKLTHDIINGKLFEINLIPFHYFSIQFDNLGSIEVVKENKSKANDVGQHIDSFCITYRISNDGKTKEYKLGNRNNYSKLLEGRVPISYIEDNFPFLKRVGTRTWFDIRANERITYDEIVNTYGEVLFMNKELNDVLTHIRETMPVHFINANRLIKSSSINENSRYDSSISKKENSVPSVLVYSKELAEIIENTLAKSGTLTQELDRTFPARLIQIMTCSNNNETITIDSINKELEKLENRRIKLEEVGLLATSNNTTVQPTGDIDKSTIKVLSLYINDTKEKLNVFNEVESKINLMKEIINKRFTNKIMKTNKTGGFVFELPDKSFLSPDKLSSGEQNELVLIFELLFKSETNSLILIDEPEISLHIAWQQQFLEDMLKISKLTGINILIATHSPDIINGRWDLTTGLEEC